MQKNLILSIQDQLKELTDKKFSKAYIVKFITPIIEYIVFSKQKKFLIAGSQGIGKSTLVKILQTCINFYYKKNVLSLSLDDYYLTKKERIVLSKKIHPLFLTRGVPGTHDLKKLEKNINSFEKGKYPIKLPIFNKLKDDRSKKIKTMRSKNDILLLEGWCCGCPSISQNYLFKSINNLEKYKDKNKKWRRIYNKKLKFEYANLFNRFSAIIYIKPPSFSKVVNWRLKQEKMMGRKNFNTNSMNKKQIEDFVQYYEKITKWMIKKMPLISDLTIFVDKNQKIKKIN